MEEELTQETRKKYEHGYMLVGQFMSIWSILEGSVNAGVGKLLGMDTLEATIATANMQFRSKVHILKAVVHLRCGLSIWGKDAIKSIEEAGTLSDTWRNVVAHNAFVPHEDGVRFLIVRARGKLDFPETVRSETDFLVVCGKLGNLAERIDEIVARVVKMKGKMTFSDLVKLWSSAPPPQPEGENHLGHLLPSFLGFAPPTNEESPQTAQEPEGKEAQ
jgi:hypothetical protein